MVAENTDVEIECSASLAPLLPGEDCGGGTVEIRFSNDDCRPPKKPKARQHADLPPMESYTYCIDENVQNDTILYIPHIHARYQLDFASTDLQGRQALTPF